MIFNRNTISFAISLLMLASNASAQLCKEPSSEGSTSLSCDMTMRDMLVTCDTRNTAASCPPKPMPMIDTPLKSYIKDYSPYLYYALPDPNDSNIPYAGTYYRGTQGEKSIALQEFGNTAPGQIRITSCVPQIKLPSEPTSKEDIAKLTRLEMDNCANQFIMNLSISPFQRAHAALPSGDNPDDPAELVTPETRCQPLNTAPMSEEEYVASDYLEVAWIKLLNDPKYRKNKEAVTEPQMPDKISIKNTAEKATKLPSPFPEVKLASIATSKFEEIYDPSHPFTPRWDFKWNERDHYSPKTKDYGGDAKNGVFCAGDKSKNIIKVDILTFRETALKFDQHINDRIEYNKNCIANSGLQANPCCVMKPMATPPYVKCDPLPCAECYAMTAASPVCSTDYITTPDRKSVITRKGIYPVFPVPPELRIAGLGSMAANMALGQLNANTPIGAVKAALDSQSALLKSLPNKISAEAVTDMLKHQVKVAINVTGIPNFNNYTDLLNMPQNLINKYADMGMGPAQNLIKGQLDVMGTITDLTKGGKIDLTTSLSSLAQSSGLLKGLPSTKTLNDIQGLLKGQTDIIAHLPIDKPLNQALSGLKSVNGLVNSLSDLATSPEKAKELMKGSVAIMDGMPSGTLVGTAQNAIKSQLAKFSQLPVTMKLGDAVAKVNLNTNLGSIKANLSLDTPLGEVNALLNSQLQGLGDHDPTAPLKDFVGVLKSNIGDVLKLPAGTPLGEIDTMLKSTNTAISEMAKSLPFKEISGALTPMIKTLSGLDGNINLGNLGGMTDELQKSLKSLGTSLGSALKLDDVKKFMDSQIGGVLKMPGLDKLDLKQFKDIMAAQQGILNQAKDMVKGVTGAIDGVMTPIKDAMNKITDTMNTQINNITKSITSGINSAVGGAIDSMKDTIGQVTGVITKQLDALNKIVSAPGKAIGDVGAKVDAAIASNVPGVSQVLSAASLAKVVVGLGYPRIAKCTPDEKTDNKPPMASLCKDLRRPVAMVNKLKMRYHNPDEPDTMVLTEGVSEGLTFKEYFGDHMPYPRLWDTGTSIQKNTPADVKFQEPTDTSGQYTAIVGVGREATPKTITDPDKIRKDQRCLAGGWGEDTSFGGISVKKSDPITSWTELKLYQSRTYRNFGLACIGRYEKTFKMGSTENVLLAQVGAEWSRIVVTQCPKKADGTLDEPNCKYLTYQEYQDAGGANATTNSVNTITNYKQDGWPLAWRGYISSSDDTERFPNFGGSGGLKTGLDSADLGDIILLPKGSSKAGDKPGLPKLAKVSKVYRCDDNKNCSVEVAEVDNGKYPDSCGTTDGWGEVKTRTIYKPGKMPPNISSEIERIKSTASCEDTKLSHCVLEQWDSIQYYRIAEDVRSTGCDKLKASECK